MLQLADMTRHMYEHTRIHLVNYIQEQLSSYSFNKKHQAANIPILNLSAIPLIKKLLTESNCTEVKWSATFQMVDLIILTGCDDIYSSTL